MLSVFMLNVVMLSVVAQLSGVLLALPTTLHQAGKANEGQAHWLIWPIRKLPRKEIC